MVYRWSVDLDARSEIISRIEEEGLLSIGWSGNETHLRISDADFVANCKKRYKLKTTRVAKSLTKIRDIRKGDILVTPHLPCDGYVSFHIASDDFCHSYNYQPNDVTHLGHRIKISRSYGMDGSISLGAFELLSWQAKLRWLRLPVLELKRHYKSLFTGMISSIEAGRRNKFKPSILEKYEDKIRNNLLSGIQKALSEVSPSGGIISFKRICERLIISYGYKIITRNMCEREGGDIELLCARDTAGPSPFGDGLTLVVQIKIDLDTSSEHSVKQVLQMATQYKYRTADCCVMSLAHRFSKDAETLSKNNGVVLLNGSDIAVMYFKFLADTATSS